MALRKERIVAVQKIADNQINIEMSNGDNISLVVEGSFFKPDEYNIRGLAFTPNGEERQVR